MLIRAISSETLKPILRSQGWAYLAPCDVLESGFRYAVRLGTRTAVTVEVAGLGHSTRIRTDRTLTAGQGENVKETVKHMLSIDFPLDDFMEICRSRRAAPLRRLARQGWGRMFRSPTFWEDAVKTLCTTNASWGYTQAVSRRSGRCGAMKLPEPPRFTSGAIAAGSYRARRTRRW